MNADSKPSPVVQNLEEFWMPFTANQRFKAEPKILAKAQGMYYISDRGQRILDGTSGLWCSNAGHCRAAITEAVKLQINHMDFGPTFQVGHPIAYRLAERLCEITPEGFDHVFFTNSGSESADTALKIALAYHRARGDSGRTRLIGREKGYHGTNFGGMSVGGIPGNREAFGKLLPDVDHLCHTLDIERNAFSRGLPEHGVELADDLERLCQLHDPATIAAVIVEPIACSGGVVFPADGYLKRLREICDRHGILLIFDEVITGFGRVGKAFAAERFNVIPDIITTAKGLTNGAIPMGAVFVKGSIYEAFMQGPGHGIELFHGYTYSGHPVAAAAALAALDIYQQENLFERTIELESYWEEAVHSLKGLPNIIDIRNYGLIAGIEFSSREGNPGARVFDIFTRCFHEEGLLIRPSVDIIALSPPLIIEKAQIDQIFETLSRVIKETA
ncbi:MAG: aspartate aminotransferase family protein [Gammaproteobacteria bacterium]|jgi:beta-alanine--pyruvate transaminase|nr:aspartate aminotransferase family protein [Gammaproteobacteria bacterium]MDP6098024.1 aspartate aminotransferase family protein [Gammaproteobacteria bacterium]MDP7455038.1 aspartate aminotransferase family protein [Gammaproteobacteria bacterium]|tara:strand:- start:551 stop:1888 length:1338 start_codon:yes stop_codon:yes gene_type:complete